MQKAKASNAPMATRAEAVQVAATQPRPHDAAVELAAVSSLRRAGWVAGLLLAS